MKPLGELEFLILLALLRLGEEAYGVSVRREIERRAERTVATGALYTVLARLEDKGLVSSFAGEPTAERGGRRKKHYRLEDAGRRALAQTHRAILGMSEGLDEQLQTLVPEREGTP